MRRAAAFVVLASLTACGLTVTGVDPAPIATSTPETGSTTTPETGPETGPIENDAGSDGNDANDAATTTDAADAADTGPTGYCSTLSPTPTFCADFDTTTDPGWQSFPLDAGTMVDTTSKNLHAVTSNQWSAALKKSIVIQNGFDLDFDVLFTTIPPASAGVISPILISPPSFPGQDFYLFVAADKSYFQEYGDDYSTTKPALSLGTWHHVTMILDMGTVDTKVTAKVDGVAYWQDHTVTHAWAKGLSDTFEFGVASLYQAQAGDVRIDNVVIRTR